jgi:2'-5' RNA ligase superfamily protein
VAQTSLVVPVAEAEPLIRGVVLRRFPALRVAAEDVIAHVTLLGPFLPLDRLDAALLDELARYFAARPPFPFRLSEVRRFSGGAVYLAPEPEQPFRDMTLELAARYPETPPYGGQFDHIVPHLTIGFATDETSEAWLVGEARRFGPISTRAVEARLVEADETFLATRHRFPLGQPGQD